MIKKVVFVFVILALLVAACSAGFDGKIAEEAMKVPATGQVFPLQLRSTLWGMQQAVREFSGTSILQKDNLVTFIWNVRSGWGFAVIDTSSHTAVQDFAKVAGNGNLVNPTSISDLVSYLKENGWKAIPASSLPRTIVQALLGSSSWLTQLAANMTTFLVLPAGVLTTPDVLQEYEDAVGGIDT
jgi:hypothetical protein